MSAKSLAAATMAVFIAACASQNAAPQDAASGAQPNGADVEALASLMTDHFETAPNDPGNDIRDQRVRIASPALDGVWLYYQLNTGPERKVYRQRVIRLSLSDDATAVLQHTYGLKDPDRYVDAWSDPALLAALAPDDVEPFFEEGCEQVWRREGADAWRGYVDPETCRIFSERRQSHIAIEAEARLDETAYRQTERGYDENGEKLFGTEPGEFIVLYRQ